MPKLTDNAVQALWAHLQAEYKPYCGMPDMPCEKWFNEAIEAYNDAMVLDLHLDTLLQTCFFDYKLLERHDPDWEPEENEVVHRMAEVFEQGEHQPRYNHSDVPRMIEGGMSGAVFSIHWWPRSLFRFSDPYDRIQAQFATLDQAAAQAPDKLRRCHDPRAVRDADSAGLIAAMTGVEGVHCLGKDLSWTRQKRLDRIEQMRKDHGCAYLTLNHQTESDGSYNGWSMFPWDRHEGETRDYPLTDFGRQIVETCNDVGVLVDVTHTNKGGIMQACSISRKPVIVSHSARHGTLGEHDKKFGGRLLDEESLIAVANTGGVVGLIMCPEFLGNIKEVPIAKSLAGAARHVAEMVRVLDAYYMQKGRGIKHIALGSDFDGWIPSIPLEMEDISYLPLLAYYLRGEGLEKQQITQVLGENFLNAWDKALNGD